MTHPVIALLSAARAAGPDVCAVEAAGETLTYGELTERVEAHAAFLTESGVVPGERVLLIGERTSHFVITLLAVWSAGATPVPVDGAHPPARIEQYRTASRAHWTLWPGPEPKLHGPHNAALGGSTFHAQSPSHLLFTTGTTGTPAAVAVPPEPMETMGAWYAREFAPGPGDRVPLLGGLGHDPLLRDLLASFLGRATLIIPEASVLTSPGHLAEFVTATGPTILHCTPALLEFGLLSVPAGTEFPSVRLILSGGAPLHYDLAARVLRSCPSARLLNVYGATETPQIAAAHEVTAIRPAKDGTPAVESDSPLPIGAGVAGADVVLAAELPFALPTARPDEIVVRSPNLATGYFNADRDNGRFEEDPLGEVGFRLYRTGDLGVRNPDGELLVVGRTDRQVSVNGYRVALEEVEAAALSHPSVTHAAAAFRSGPFGDVLSVRVAVIDETIEPALLRRYLRSLLPSHAVPSALRIAEVELDHNHKKRFVERA